MKDKPSEWVAVSDLMAGVVAVVMLLLIISVVQQTYAELKHKQEREKGVIAQQQVATKVLQEMKKSFNESGIGNLAEFDIKNHKIILNDSVFARGSACVTPKAKEALLKVQQRVAEYLEKVPSGNIVVEGHTDNLPVNQPVTDLQKSCAVYDDNYTLSAARAREARKLLIGVLTNTNSKRVIVAGYGDSHPLSGIPNSDGRNRRIEIVFLFQ